MMDSNWGDHNCFSKMLLDWLTPQVVGSGSRTVVLRADGDLSRRRHFLAEL